MIFYAKLSNATKWFCLFRIIAIRVYYGFGHHQYNDVHSYLQQICKKRKNQIKEESEYLFKSSHFCLGVGALEKKKDLAMLMANFSQIRVRICNMQLPFVICIWKKERKKWWQV